MERWMGLPSGFCKYSSSERRYRAWISCKAELGDTRGVDLRKCLHPVHQRPYSINQIECSTDSNGCPEQITGTVQSTVHPIQQSCVAQLTASARSANESRKVEKKPAWTMRASCLQNSLRNPPRLQQKVCLCRKLALSHEKYPGNRGCSVALFWDHSSQAVFQGLSWDLGLRFFKHHPACTVCLLWFLVPVISVSTMIISDKENEG